MNTRRIKNSIW